MRKWGNPCFGRTFLSFPTDTPLDGPFMDCSVLGRPMHPYRNIMHRPREHLTNRELIRWLEFRIYHIQSSPALEVFGNMNTFPSFPDSLSPSHPIHSVNVDQYAFVCICIYRIMFIFGQKMVRHEFNARTGHSGHWS